MRKQRGSVIPVLHDDRADILGAAPVVALFLSQSEEKKLALVLQRLSALGCEIVSPESAAQAAHALALGAGDGARDAMQFAAEKSVARLTLWNPSVASLRAVPRGLNMPALVLMDDAARPFERLMGQLAVWQLRRQNERSVLQHTPTHALRDAALLEWAMRGQLAERRAASPSFVSIARKVATGAAVGAMALSPIAAVAKTVAAPAPAPATSTQNSFDAMFADGMTLNSAQVKGDGYSVPASHARAGNPPPNKTKAKKEHRAAPADGITIGSDQVRGDGYSPQSIQSTGSRALVDGNGVKYFINTNITFSTSSSASAAMSEARFVGAVNATTSAGGTVASTLRDAFDGYNSLCVDVNTGGTSTCQTGRSNIFMYNQNSHAITDTLCTTGGQVLFPTQIMSGVEVSRKVYVPGNDGFARWLNIFHNPTTSTITIRAVIANNLGSDGNTAIVNSSSGLPAGASSQWVTTFQNYSGNTSSDPRLGHVLQGGGALVTPLSGATFANVNDNPFWWYVLTLTPGQTQIIANLVTLQGSKALAASKAAELVTQMTTLGSNALACTTDAERKAVANFVPAEPTAIDLASFGAKNVCENVEVSWEALRETGTAGYLVYRGAGGAFADASLLNQSIIMANGAGGYKFVDDTAKAGKTYTYWLVEVAADGSHKVAASASVTAEGCAVSP